jgi:hypothetical protein
LITPNKADLYPEDIPDRFMEKIRHGDRQPADYEIMVPFLKRYGVPFVDGRQITLEHRDGLPVRDFPKTGSHWSRAVAYFATAALLETIGRESGREMPQLSESIESIDQRPDYADDDLWSLLNLIQKPGQRYLHPGFHIPESWPKRTGILTIVGGSFVGQIVSALDVAQVFERINYYYYFKMSRRQFPGEIVSSVDENAIPWKEDFWNTRAVVLEENETAINTRHVHAFLMAELAVLQQKAPQEQSVADSPRPLCWGFGAGENGTALLKKGFSIPEHQLTWITGQDAEIELPSPVNTELQLILEAMPALGEGVSARIVKVEANGTPVGAVWLADSDVQFYSLTIKAAANSAPFLKLHFSFSPALSPAARDSQPREIGLARLALVPIGPPAVQETGGNYTTPLIRQ